MLVMCASIAQARGYDFKVIAGGYTGDGLQATSAVLQSPADIAYDNAGNLYITDGTENRIRRVSTTGVITTVAGNGDYGFSGDGGPASLATLRNPNGLAFDAAGSLYFADSGNHRVRRISSDGNISTVVGDGLQRVAGDGGLAAEASLSTPYGITIGANGDLYISDFDPLTYYGSVRKVNSAGVITTVLSSTIGNYTENSPSLYRPHGIALDTQGNLFVADYGNKAILKMTPAGAVTTVMNRYGAGNGVPAPYPPAQTVLFGPSGVQADSSGNLYITDANCNLLKLTAAGTVQHVAGGYDCTFSGDGGDASTAEIKGSDGMTFDASGALLFADSGNGRIRRISAGVINTIAGKGTFSGDGGSALAASLRLPTSLSIDRNGTVYVADRGNDRIRRVTTDGRIETIGGGGTSTSDGVPATTASFFLPWGVAVGDSGTVFVAATYEDRLRRIATTGTIDTLTEYVGRPYGINLDAAGNLYAATGSGVRKVYKVSPAGEVTLIAGNGPYVGEPTDGSPAVDASLSTPWDVAVDASGNVFIADGARVYKVTPQGLISKVAGAGTYDNPAPRGDGGPATLGLVYAWGLAVAPNGTLYLAGESLRIVTPDGIINTVQNLPHDILNVALDSKGAIYVSTRSGRILKAAGPPPAKYDFNGDGISDMLWRNIKTGANVIWDSADSGQQQPMAGVTNLAWKIAGAGDFDGDGVSDVLWRNLSTGTNVIWKGGNSASPLFVRTVSNLAWKVASVADFNGDGRADILWRNADTGSNTIWRSADYRTTQSMRAVTSLDWEVVSAGDFNADHASDVLWRNRRTGANTVWLSADAAKQQRVTGVTNLSWRIAGVGDFNGDGRADIFWRNADTGGNIIWRSGISSTQQPVVSVRNLDWKVVAIADFNGDGNADALWHNDATGASAIWQSARADKTQQVTTVSNLDWQIVK